MGLPWYECIWIDEMYTAVILYPFELQTENDRDENGEIKELKDLEVFDDWTEEDWELYFHTIY